MSDSLTKAHTHTHTYIQHTHIERETQKYRYFSGISVGRKGEKMWKERSALPNKDEEIVSVIHKTNTSV